MLTKTSQHRYVSLLICCQICGHVESEIGQVSKKITVDSVNKESEFSGEMFVLPTSDEIRRFVTRLMCNLVHTNTLSFDY